MRFLLKSFFTTLVILVPCFVLAILFPKPVSAAAFNVTVTDPTQPYRWSDKICRYPQGIALQCLSNCSGSWKCEEPDLGGHFDAESTNGRTVQIKLVPPTTPVFPTVSWVVTNVLTGAVYASGSDWTASFLMPRNAQTFEYNLHFTMQPPPPTPTPALVPDCYDLNGPSTVVLGDGGTFTATFNGDPFLFDHVALTFYKNGVCNNIDTAGYLSKLFARGEAELPVTESFTWMPLTAGTYTAYCRSWNDGRAECRGDCVDGINVYQCPGGPDLDKESEVMAVVVVEPTPNQTQCELQGGECMSIRYGQCPSGYDPTPNDDLGCPATESCCFPQEDECHNVGLNWLCRRGFERCDAPFRYVCCTNTANCPRVQTPAVTREYLCDPDDFSSGIETAIGCVVYENINAFIKFMLIWFIGISGGTAFMLMVYGGFLFITSAGNPEKVRVARTILVSALSGLLFLIFSVFILRVIGVQILNIPGL